jgi:hypothetical protein
MSAANIATYHRLRHANALKRRLGFDNRREDCGHSTNECDALIKWRRKTGSKVAPENRFPLFRDMRI